MNKRSKLFLFSLLFIVMAGLGNSQTIRSKKSINEGWRFLNEGIAFGQNFSLIDESSWEKVTIPHTWNNNDPFDDKKSYKRGIAWYRKSVKVSNERRASKKHYLYFEGVNQVADVFVNGIHVGRHKGGYTAFSVDISKALVEEEEQSIAVMVNSAHNAYIAPLSVGYALYGGIYRDVWLVSTENLHFDMDNHGSSGVFISTPMASAQKAQVAVKGALANDSDTQEVVTISSDIFDAADKKVGSTQTEITINPGEKKEYSHTIDISNPNLWSPDSPYLYAVKSSISKQGDVVDVVENSLGVRWFSMDANTGFSINGKPLKLKGTNRHQDKQGKGAALTNEEHRLDMISIKEMGCNFLRLAHYPQDPEMLRAADQLGLLIWEEVPLVNYMTIHPEFLANSKHMIREMIRQHYNHPSVLMWGSMNEVFLWGNNEDRISKQTDSAYMKDVSAFAKAFNQLVKEEDSSRFSTLAMHMSSDYDQVGIEDLADVAAYNIYSGWYGGEFQDFGRTFDRKHENKPNQKIFISEYGAGSDTRLNSKEPERFDFTGQYQRKFNESYLRQIKERPFIFGSAIWNQFDFSQPHVGGSIPHLNQKGMSTWDRKNKDVYYFYKANWNPEPMIHIAEKDWTERSSITQEENYEITVYSNLDKVTLFHNGKNLGAKRPDDIHKATWKVSLKSGKNNLRATGAASRTTVEDFTAINVSNIKNSSLFAINVGSNAQYTDSFNLPWIQDDEFNGVYGYHSGTPTLMNRKYIIRGSIHDPMYYTYLDDLKKYEVNLKNGTYKVTMFFIENEMIEPGERVFDVSINKRKVIESLDMAKEVGFCYGVEKTFEIEVTDNKLLFEFDATVGKAVFSGLQILKSK